MINGGSRGPRAESWKKNTHTITTTINKVIVSENVLLLYQQFITIEAVLLYNNDRLTNDFQMVRHIFRSIFVCDDARVVAFVLEHKMWKRYLIPTSVINLEIKLTIVIL